MIRSTHSTKRIKSTPNKSSVFSSLSFKSKRIDSLITAKAPDEVIYKEMGMKEDANKWEHKFFVQFLKCYPLEVHV